MSLRDWFAGQALAGSLGAPVPDIESWAGTYDADLMAQQAYEMADAMLRERTVRPA